MELSQGRLGGRNGSSSCTIIAVLLAKSFYQLPQLTFPQSSLPKVWNHAVADAIVEGNQLYDTTFSRPGLILDVTEVVDILNKNNCEETITEGLRTGCGRTYRNFLGYRSHLQRNQNHLWKNASEITELCDLVNNEDHNIEQNLSDDSDDDATNGASFIVNGE